MNYSLPSRRSRWLALVFGLAIAAQTEAAINYSITFVDPGGAHASYYAGISSNLPAAGATWARYFAASGNLAIEVQFDAQAPGVIGYSLTSGFVRNDGTRDIFEQGAAYELRTGIDPNGNAADIIIRLRPNFLLNVLWLDPNPTMRTDPIPADRLDAVSVFMRNLAYAFAFNGWRDPNTGVPPATYMSTFDVFIVSNGADFFFNGASASALYGGSVPLTYGRLYTLGNAAPRPGSDLQGDLINGIGFAYQARYYISALDLAIAKDCGMAVREYLEVLSLTKPESNQFLLQGLGVPTAPHRVLATDNLAQEFQFLGNTTADSNGNFTFPDSTTVARRFYQVAYP